MKYEFYCRSCKRRREEDFTALQTTLRPVIAKMNSPRKRGMMEMRWAIGAHEGKKTATLEEVGRSYGVTRERVRQIEAKLMEDAEIM